jgi:hypothetical protein
MYSVAARPCSRSPSTRAATASAIRSTSSSGMSASIFMVPTETIPVSRNVRLVSTPRGLPRTARPSFQTIGSGARGTENARFASFPATAEELLLTLC